MTLTNKKPEPKKIAAKRPKMGRTVGQKITLGTIAVTVVIVVVCAIFFSVFQQMSESQAEIRTVRVPQSLIAKDMQMQVVQMQQWLTYISATRAQDGLDDGFKEAEASRAAFLGGLEQIRKTYARDGNANGLKQADEVERRLKAWYAVGERMAHAYIDFGPAEGNKIMLEFDTVSTALQKAMEPIIQEQIDRASLEIQSNIERAQILQIAIFTGAVLILGLMSIGGYLMNRGIARPLASIIRTMNLARDGDDTARSNIRLNNEWGLLSTAFDEMMDERVRVQMERSKVQQEIKEENDRLNESVIALLQAVHALSELDLTAKAPVSDNIVGTIASALNSLSSQTGQVLSQVSNVATDVTAASLAVREQAQSIAKSAASEREEAAETAQALVESSVQMAEIAQLANSCNQAAESAILTTKRALETVQNTVIGIGNTRETIRETEKRIKRLGERSQEISGAIGMINQISERTHILALNASMHAASAGEAGRGFAVVAEEVQRLAENARQATAQISTLVANIQTETADTVAAMNRAIEQVVEGSRLAETAGAEMKATEKSTSGLVEMVRDIASSSQVQAQRTEVLLERAVQIQKSTEETESAVVSSLKQSESLVEYARRLMESVRVFRLPE